jgi:hypothetical protein
MKKQKRVNLRNKIMVVLRSNSSVRLFEFNSEQEADAFIEKNQEHEATKGRYEIDTLPKKNNIKPWT